MEQKRKIFNFARMKSSTKAITGLGLNTRIPNITHQTVDQALTAGDANRLREIASALRATSGDYSRLENYFGRLLICKFVTSPTDIESLYGSDFITADEKIQEYVSSANISSSTMEVIETVVSEGVYYGHEMDLNGEKIFIKLPPEYCRSRFKIKGLYSLEIDLRMYQQYRGEELEEALESSPPDIAKAYRAYESGSVDSPWFMTDYTQSRVHFLSKNKFPLLTPIFHDILDLQQGKGKDRKNDDIKLKNIVAQKIPVDENGEIALEMEDIIELHENAKSMVGDDNTEIITTPCELTFLRSHDNFSARSETISEREKKNLHASAGTNSALLGGESKGSVGLEKSIDADAALLYPLLTQSTSWYNMKFETITKIPFEIVFSPVTALTRDVWFKTYKDAASCGQPTKLLAAAVLDIPQNVAVGLLHYENHYLNLIEEMRPNQTSYTTAGGETESPGAPVKKEVTEEGAETQEGAKNE